MSEIRRVIILTSVPRGFASLCLPILARTVGVEVAGVILCGGRIDRPWRHRWRKFRKLLKIGPRGAMNGIRMRAWYGEAIVERLEIPSIGEVAQRLGIAVWETPSVSARETVERLSQAKTDLALSLGNGFIPERVYSLPWLGTLNVHHELLPEMQGAQSVIWQLHQGSTRTGFTIHQVAREIDAGDILFRQETEIDFGATLAETVIQTNIKLWKESAAALAGVVADFERYDAQRVAQRGGRRYTTPSYGEYREILRQHERLAAQKRVS